MSELDIDSFNRSVEATSRRYSAYSSCNNSAVMNMSSVTDRFNES